MAKRSMRSKSRDSAYQENVHPLFPGHSNHQRAQWTPHDPAGLFWVRLYVKDVRA